MRILDDKPGKGPHSSRCPRHPHPTPGWQSRAGLHRRPWPAPWLCASWHTTPNRTEWSQPQALGSHLYTMLKRNRVPRKPGKMVGVGVEWGKHPVHTGGSRTPPCLTLRNEKPPPHPAPIPQKMAMATGCSAILRLLPIRQHEGHRAGPKRVTFGTRKRGELYCGLSRKH